MTALLQKAKAYLDARRGERVTLGELAQAMDASPFHLQRRFKEAFGVSPRGYQDAYRVEAVKSSLQNGSRVADAVFDAGYGSISRFYEKPHLGMKARHYRARGKGQRVRFSAFATSLGVVLVAATDAGVCAVKLGADAARAPPAISMRTSAVATGPIAGAAMRMKRNEAPQIAASVTSRAASAAFIYGGASRSPAGVS